ncbi:MAG: phage terminase small subunit P27 family [Actinomycetota bacterium]
MPTRLGEAGTALWEALWSGPAAAWLTAVDTIVVGILCESVDERVELRGQVLASGDWRDRTALRALDQEITRMLAACGLTPADRAHLGFVEVRDETSKLDELRARVAAKRRDTPNG